MSHPENKKAAMSVYNREMDKLALSMNLLLTDHLELINKKKWWQFWKH